jgi:hypothetical protein
VERLLGEVLEEVPGEAGALHDTYGQAVASSERARAWSRQDGCFWRVAWAIVPAPAPQEMYNEDLI